MNINLYEHFDANIFDELMSGGAIDLISIESTRTNYIKKWRCNQKQFKIKFSRECNTFEEANRLVNNIFTELYEFIRQNSKPNDKVRVVFMHPSLISNVSCPFVAIENFSAKFMIDMMQRVSQSKRELKIDGELLCMAQIVDLPVGSGHRIERYKQDTYTVKIVNNDNLCALRAILISIAYLEKDPARYKYCKIHNAKFEKKVLDLARACNIPDKPCSLKEIKLVEAYLREYSISVIGEDFNSFLYIGPPKNKYIYIWHNNNHYDSITSMTAAKNIPYYCDLCKIGYYKTTDHKCENTCHACNRQKCIELKKIYCKFCKTKCGSDQCLTIHQELKCMVLKM